MDYKLIREMALRLKMVNCENIKLWGWIMSGDVSTCGYVRRWRLTRQKNSELWWYVDVDQ